MKTVHSHPTLETIQQLPGSDLRVGDTLELWWGRDTITSLAPYKGPLAYVFGDGAQVATFARSAGMTVNNSELYAVVARMGSSEPSPGAMGESLACLGFLAILAVCAFAWIGTPA